MIRTASRGYSPLLAHPFAEGGVNMDEIFKRGTCRHFKELTPVAKEDLLTLEKQVCRLVPAATRKPANSSSSQEMTW